MRFDTFSHFLRANLPSYVSKIALALDLGVERRKIDDMLEEPPGPVNYEEGKLVEDFIRSKHIQASCACTSITHVVTSFTTNRFDPNLKDFFAAAYWPSDQLVILKPIGSTAGYYQLPQLETEKRARIVFEALKNVGVSVNPKTIRYFEVQKLPKHTFIAQIMGLPVGPIEYETQDGIENEILLKSNWF